MKFEKGDIVYWMGIDKAFGIVIGDCEYYKGCYRLYANGSYDTHSSCSGKNLRHATDDEKDLLITALAKQNKYYCEQTKTIKEMQKEFTKKDLKSGMWVECRNGNRYLLIPDPTSGELWGCRDGGRLRTEDYNEDLTYRDEDWWISKVWQYANPMDTYEVDFGDRGLIWDRHSDKILLEAKIQEIQDLIDDMKDEIEVQLNNINKLKQKLK